MNNRAHYLNSYNPPLKLKCFLCFHLKNKKQNRIHEEIDGQLDQGRIPCYATDAEWMP
jgi:hypothetical protein